MKPQLLDLLTISPSFDNYISINNEIINCSLQQFSSQFTHIIGASLSGKTHLLKAWVQLAIEQNKAAVYLDGEHLGPGYSLRSLANAYSFIALDNIDKLDNERQIELFDLFNSIKLNNLNNCLLTSSHIHLEQAPNMRQDLKTRILSGLNLSLRGLNDQELLYALAIYTNKAGIKITPAELKYLVNHYTRNIGMLINAIHKIANTAVLENRHITIPLIKQVIEQD